MCGTKPAFTSTYHPQIGGQTEVVNRTIEMYLRCFVGDRPKQWVETLPWAEYCYNTSFNSPLYTTPLRVVYGRDPPRFLSYIPGTTRIDILDRALLERDEFLGEVRTRFQQARG